MMTRTTPGVRRVRRAGLLTTLGTTIGLALVAAGVPSSAAAATAPASRDGAAPPLAAARGLALRLRDRGRAVATIERRAYDPIAGRERVLRGRLTLELPDRARLEFPASGEIVALRGDGGEWLQPALSQMLRLGPRNAAAGRRWWDLLLPGEETRFTEHPLSPRRYAVVSPAGAGFESDTAWVGLDGAGLPASLEYADAAGGRIAYRFRGWSFQRPRGRASFELAPPAGFEVVDLP